MSFIQDYLTHTEALEAPKSFWEWSCYAMIAAVLRDSCYFEMGYRKMMPNLYVLLLAPSGADRKSAPFSVVEELIDNDLVGNTKMLRGQCTIQALQDILSQEDRHPKSKRQLKDGSVMLLAEEFSSFFIDDPKLIQNLTDMHDFRAEYSKKLKTGPSNTIRNMCITMLAASNQSLLDTVFNSSAVFGGLLSRTCVIVPDGHRPANSLLRVDLLAVELRKKNLIKQLGEISRLKGTFKITPAAEHRYEEWYVQLYASMRQHPDPTGVKARVHANVLKLAMILAASELRLEITLEDIETSIQKFHEISVNYLHFAQRVGTATDVEVASRLMEMLREKFPSPVMRVDFFAVNWGFIVMKDFDDLIKKLEIGEVIKVVGTQENTVAYYLTEKTIEQMRLK